MISLHQTLGITRLGQQGEGVAEGPEGQIFVPYALPGDQILATTDGSAGTLVDILKAGPDRIAPFCPHYGTCGGCAVQALQPSVYAAWKRSLVVAALSHGGLEAPVADLVDAHGEGRRRVTFHAARDASGRMSTGFMQARSHVIIDIEACPLLCKDLENALPAARQIAKILAPLEKPLDLVATATLTGLDIDIRGCGRLERTMEERLIGAATQLRLARLANHGTVLVEARTPVLKIGLASITPPPGCFLQATEAGEAAMWAAIQPALKGARQVADLFAGLGTFALRLAQNATIHAVENDAPALAALTRAARSNQALRPITTEQRDLFRRPLMGEELARFDAIVFDPPRAGAMAQAQTLAGSAVPVVIAVSCNLQTYVRDAKILVAGGYVLQNTIPIDQFRHSPHVEMVGIFTKLRKGGRKRGLLS